MTLPIIIDIEMSGLTPDLDHILEIAAIAVTGPVSQEIFHTFVRPPAEFMDSMAEDEEIMSGFKFMNDVSPITYQMLDMAPSEESASMMFDEWIRSMVNLSEMIMEEPGLEFFAYNDSTKRQFLEYSPWAIGEAQWGNDPMKQMAYEAILNKYSRPGSTHVSNIPDRCLEGSMEMAGLQVWGPRHSALYDALNVTRLWRKIQELEA